MIFANLTLFMPFLMQWFYPLNSTKLQKQANGA